MTQIEQTYRDFLLYRGDFVGKEEEEEKKNAHINTRYRGNDVVEMFDINKR